MPTSQHICKCSSTMPAISPSRFMAPALLYNLLLAESPMSNDLIDEYRESLDEWWEVIQAARATLTAWDRKAFWTMVHEVKTHRIPMPTQSFVEQWLELTLSAPSLESLIDNEPVRQVIVNRERQLKKARARIGNRSSTGRVERQLWYGPPELSLAGGSGHYRRHCRSPGGDVTHVGPSRPKTSVRSA